MNKIKKNALKLFLFVMCLCFVFALCAVNADSGEEAFVGAITENITADTMWGSVTPVVPIIAFVFTFAFAYGIIRKVLKKGSRGKFGM